MDFARECIQKGATNIIFTDISRDGMLEGPNFEQLEEISSLGCDIVASGGIRDIEDIRRLKAMGLYGAICGKSIYAGTLDLRQAVELCREEK
jgi:phosphoribosylformimino-5-aminoimidazole carboxamide ribotide isomerase